MLILMFYCTLFGYLPTGPSSRMAKAIPDIARIPDIAPCYWWTNLLYINNFYPTESEISSVIYKIITNI